MPYDTRMILRGHSSDLEWPAEWISENWPCGYFVVAIVYAASWRESTGANQLNFPICSKTWRRSSQWWWPLDAVCCRLEERPGNSWNNALQHCSTCNRGSGDIFMGTACGGGWALCWGLEPPLVVGGGVIGDSLTAPLDLGPNWKTNCGLHTYREPKGAARNRLYEGTLCFHPKFDLT